MILSCNTAQAESVTAIAADHPKTVVPGERSLAPETVAANPGRALEVAGQRPRTLNETVFINRAAVRDFLLEQAAGTRAHRFERVSKKTLVQINESVRQYMIAVVRRLPSKGKTI